tara:strand:- start:838 stop:1056 length:219 start_codon:yes stop_codon:yes gene_type:complete
MFTAILFVCSLIDQTNCYKLVDNRGPYETEEKCLTRVEEMINDIPNVLPHYRTVRFTCNNDKGKKGVEGLET